MQRSFFVESRASLIHFAQIHFFLLFVLNIIDSNCILHIDALAASCSWNVVMMNKVGYQPDKWWQHGR